MSATAPTGVQLCSQTDVELVIGGSQILVQLLDKDGDSVADSDMVTAIIAHASSECLATIGTQYLPSLTAPYPDVLVFAVARLAGYFAYTMGTDIQGVPAQAIALRDEATRIFDRIRNREISLGVVIAPASNQKVEVVDRNPNNDQTTQDSLKGSIW